MGLSVKDIRALMKATSEHGLAEFEMESTEERIFIKRDNAAEKKAPSSEPDAPSAADQSQGDQE